MRRFTLVISPIALALLGACATSDPVTPAPAPVVVAPAPVVTAPLATVVTAPMVVATPTAIRAGHGRVETITPAAQSAASGGKTVRRIGIKMDDGTVQYVDTPAEGLTIGERIELTADGQIRH
jgi:hypothetical protein